MTIVPLFIGTDLSNHLGRLDRDSLPQQTLMELVIDGITNRERICGSKENPQDVSEWSGLRFNVNEEIVQIDWRKKALKGSLSLEWLPGTFRRIDAAENAISGTLDLENLPNGLIDIMVYQNRMTGTLSLTHLPESLVQLNVYQNRFTGTVDLTSLPPNLEWLYIDHNDLTGNTDFSKLPKSLKILDVSSTGLEGEIYVTPDNDDIFCVEGSNVKIIY